MRLPGSNSGEIRDVPAVSLWLKRSLISIQLLWLSAAITSRSFIASTCLGAVEMVPAARPWLRFIP